MQPIFGPHIERGYSPLRRSLGSDICLCLEEREASIRATKPIVLKPYKVDEAFQKRSYAKRYELVCERLVRDRLYDAACFFTSNARTGKRGEYKEPSEELSIKNFAISLHARAAAFAGMGEELKVFEGNNEK